MADSVSIETALKFLAVAALWGFTNPLLKKASAGVEKVRGDTPLRQALAEFRFLVTRWQYVVAFALNQSGSALYFFLLGSAPISLAVPISNSLTLLFTGFAGKLLGERFGNVETYAGAALVLAGVALCVYSKL